MKYSLHTNHYNRRRFLFRAKFLIVALILFALSTSIYLVIMMTIRDMNDEASATSGQTKGYVAASSQVMRGQYFQFQTDKTWFPVPSESTDTKFVYRSRRVNLVEHELVIYVKDIPSTLAANRVLPVNITDYNLLKPTSVSEHCAKATGGSKIGSPRVTFEKVNFACAADAAGYSVLLGQVGGSSTLQLRRVNGTTVPYAIQYTNVRANPDPNQIMEIINSFQSR